MGKVHFNYIYGIGVLGCLAMYGLLTLMSMAPVPVAVVVSVLGYCILPIVMLSAVSVVFSLQGWIIWPLLELTNLEVEVLASCIQIASLLDPKQLSRQLL